MTAAVEVKALHKSYGGPWGRKTEALAGVDLSVRAGCVFGLIGPNGAGKTTLVKSLLSVVRPSAGVIQVLGGSPEDPRVRRRIGYLPERLHLPAFFTPLRFLAEVAQLKRAQASRALRMALLERVGLAAEAGRRIGAFSKGMRQRLGLAAALVGEPDLLVLDEPTDGIDPIGRIEMRRLLESERRRGATVLINSHLLSETERTCDEVAILNGGRLVKQGPLAQLCAASRWRVRFAPQGPQPEEALRDAGFTAADAGTWWHEAPGPVELNHALDRARAAGALIAEVRHETRELEDLLAEIVRAA